MIRKRYEIGEWILSEKQGRRAREERAPGHEADCMSQDGVGEGLKPEVQEIPELACLVGIRERQRKIEDSITIKYSIVVLIVTVFVTVIIILAPILRTTIVPQPLSY